MFNMQGHSITVRGLREDDEIGEVDRDIVSMVVTGADMAEVVLLAFDEVGEVVFRESHVPKIILANYETAARTINATMEREQHLTAALDDPESVNKARAWLQEHGNENAASVGPDQVRVLIASQYPGGWEVFVREEILEAGADDEPEAAGTEREVTR